MNLRVVHIIGGGEFGGAEEHIIDLLKQLKNSHVDCEVICFYDSLFAQMLRDLDIPVLVLDYGRFDMRLLFGLSKALKERNPDIIHTHGVKANFFTRLAAKKLNESIVITTVHSLLKYDYAHPVSYKLASFLEMTTRSRTDYFIAVSNKIKEQLLSENRRPDQVKVIHHGIDVESFSPKEDPDARELAKTWSNNGDAFIVGSVGRIHPVKGFSTFVDACAKIHKQYPNQFRFVLIGEGPEREDLEAQVNKLGLEDAFIFAGFRKDIPSCLRAFDGYVNSSLSEGLGLSVMEALATGVPVVTTNVGGIKDFARHKENSYVVDRDDSDALAEGILRLYEDRQLAENLTKQGVADMREGFSQERMGRETLDYYKQCIDEKE